MRFRFCSVFAVCVMMTAFSSVAAAQCGSLATVSPNGPSSRLVLADAGGGSFDVDFGVTPGHSYSVEMKDFTFLSDTWAVGSSGIADTTASACGVTDDGTVVHTENADPVDPQLGSGAGFRASVIAGPTSSFYTVSFAGQGGASNDLRVDVSDTTLFSPRWSSSPGFHTEYGFTNTTNSTINVTLTLFNPDGSVNKTHGPDGVPAHGTTFYDTRNISAGIALSVASGGAGTATLAHDGPPGAIVGDVYIINAGFSTGPFIQAGKFEPVRQ